MAFKRTNFPGKKVFEMVVSMRFSLVLLALIGLGCALGTFIRQGVTEEEYLALYSENTYKIIKTLGFDDIYHSGWFYLLVGVFTASLILCTARQLISLLAEKKTDNLPDQNRLSAMEFNVLIPSERQGETIKRIKKTYRLTQKKGNHLVFEKGIISRWGVFITHVSILVVLAGALMGLLFGFRGFMVLVPGETKSRIAIKNNGWGEKALDFAVRCKDFKASFYPDGSAMDYVSKVEIIEDNNIFVEKSIRVNDPLYYKGTRIYQSGYGQKRKFTFRVNNEEVTVDEGEMIKKGNVVLVATGFKNKIHNFGPGVQVVLFQGNNRETTWFLPSIERLRSQKILGSNVELVDIKENIYTSLEVTKDPGVPVVWIGFCLMLFGLCMTFFTSYRRIFVFQTDNGIVVAGYALKNKETFRDEFKKLTRGASGGAR